MFRVYDLRMSAFWIPDLARATRAPSTGSLGPTLRAGEVFVGWSYQGQGDSQISKYGGGTIASTSKRIPLDSIYEHDYLWHKKSHQQCFKAYSIKSVKHPISLP